MIDLTELCQHNIRSMDLFARFGGEEFVILMPDTDSTSAEETAERLRNLVAKNIIYTNEDLELSVIISVGVSEWNSNKPIEINTLLGQADRALYQAKELGRNKVMVWQNEDQ